MNKILGFILCLIAALSGYAQTLVIAHRGASAYCEENSIESFKKAIAIGVDYIETDVHQTADSTVVIMHDLSVNRMCVIPKDISKKYSGKKILIKNISSEDFIKLRFKNSMESPPTLDSVIKLINGRCKLLIELKKGNSYYPGIEKRIITIIKNNNAEAWVNVIHSFDKDALLKINSEDTGIKLQKLIVFKFPLTSFNFAKKLNKDKFENWQGVNIYYRFITKKIIRKLHAQNKTVYAWTVNKRRPARRLIRLGVDGIITNKPDLIKQIIADK